MDSKTECDYVDVFINKNIVCIIDCFITSYNGALELWDELDGEYTVRIKNLDEICTLDDFLELTLTNESIKNAIADLCLTPKEESKLLYDTYYKLDKDDYLSRLILEKAVINVYPTSKTRFIAGNNKYPFESIDLIIEE
jgi:hypothetical protein